MVGMAAEDSALAETKRVGKELLQSRAHINNAPVLLSILSASFAPSPPAASSSPKCLVESVHCLQAFFLPLLRAGDFSPAARKKALEDLKGEAAKNGGEKREEGRGDIEGTELVGAAQAEGIYKSWVWDRYREFVSTLLRILARHGALPSLQTAALSATMEFVRHEIQGQFNNQLYFKLCSTLVLSKGFNSDILGVLASQYLKFVDISYFTYGNMEKIARMRISREYAGNKLVFSDDEDDSIHGGISVHGMVRNMFDILIHLPPPSSEGASTTPEQLWSSPCSGNDNSADKILKSKESGDSVKSCKDTKRQRIRLSKVWLSFLQLPLPLDIYKKVLVQLHKRVIPFLTNPILLSDFLTSSCDIGGLISVMALNGLFILMTNHGLEYPDFYNKLYALLEPSIFVAKHRARFFELIDTCLKSSHLPAYLAAAFAKKLGRLALSAPPAGALLIIAMVHNLLRRHPSINCLVHRDTGLAETPTSREEETNNGSVAVVSEVHRRGADPFLAFEPDIAKCNALRSSLWEIETLRSHYCPAVSRFVVSLETDLTVRAKTTEVAIADFSSGSYATIFAEEVGKRLKAVPLAFYHTIPSALFPEHSQEDFVGWSFGEAADVVAAAVDLSTSNQQFGRDRADGGSGQEDNILRKLETQRSSSDVDDSSSEESEGRRKEPPRKKRK